jgi:hypothetical protein
LLEGIEKNGRVVELVEHGWDTGQAREDVFKGPRVVRKSGGVRQ